MRPKAQFACGVGYALLWLAVGISCLAVSSDTWDRAFCLVTATLAMDAAYDAWLGRRRMQLQKVSPENHDVGDHLKPRWYRRFTMALYGFAALAFGWHAYRLGAADWSVISFVAMVALAFLLISFIWRDRSISRSKPTKLVT